MELSSFTVKKWLAIIALNAFGIFIIYLLRNFITPFLGSIIFFVLFKPLMDKLVEQRNWKESLAALLIIFVSFAIIMVPILVLSYMLYSKTTQVVNDPSSLLNIIHLLDEKVTGLLGFEVFNNENIEELKKSAGNLIPSFINGLFWTIGNIAVMYFVLYFMLVSRHKLIGEINTFLPFNNDHIKILGSELESMTLSNIIGVPAIAFIQGAAAGIGYWIFGLHEPLFWGVITAFASIIPIVGPTLIWAPACLFLLATGNSWQGFGLIAYCAAIVTNIDNVARFTIQKKFADVHPIITVFGVIIGINLFGLPGLIFGPLMLSYFVIFIRLYRKVYAAEL
jgi:predicted PurR-regulated permease PerM